MYSSVLIHSDPKAMLDYFLSSASFLPHGFCLLWRPDLVALHVASDITTGLAYFSIPLAILRLLKRRPDFEYRWVAYLFAAFIVLCGTTHFAGIAITTPPDYRLDKIGSVWHVHSLSG